MASNLTSCRQFHTYFWSGEFLRTAYHLTALFTIPMSILLFYCILYETPKRMQPMKPALINLQFWITNLDFVLTIFSCPYIYFPSASGTPLGVLAGYVGVKWQSYYGQLSVTYIGVATIVLFENRQSQINTITFKIKTHRTRIIYYMVNYISLLFIYLPFYMTNNDQDELRELVLKRIPCPTIEFDYNTTYVLLRGDEKIPFYSITMSMLLVVGQGLFFVCHAMYHLTILKNHNMSNATKKMQKKYLKCIALQLAVPMLAIVVPIIYSLYADRFDYYNQALNNNSMLAMANHGLLSHLSALYIYKPYRDFCLRKLFRRKGEASSTIVTNTSMINRIK